MLKPGMQRQVVHEIHWQPKQPHRFLDFLAAGSSRQLAAPADGAQAAVLRACIRFDQRNAASENLQEATTCMHHHVFICVYVLGDMPWKLHGAC